MSGRDVVLVLGAARSGTSALTRVLSLCGCSLPESLLAPRDMNPKGFWEPVDATKFNLEFLLRHDMSVGDPSMCLEGERDIDEQEKEGFIRQVRTFLAGCPPGPALVVKCAGVAELFELWSEAARRDGFSVKVVILFRRPQEVVASATAAFSQSVEGLSANWIKINLLSERHSRYLPRVFVEYPDLLVDWRSEVGRVSEALSIDLKVDESSVESFLTPALHRQKASGPIVETFAYSWTSRIYSILSAAARGGSIDYSTLDEIYNAYRANERAFRIAWDEWRSRPHDLQKFRESFEQWPIWQSGRDF